MSEIKIGPPLGVGGHFAIGETAVFVPWRVPWYVRFWRWFRMTVLWRPYEPPSAVITDIDREANTITVDTPLDRLGR